MLNLELRDLSLFGTGLGSLGFAADELAKVLSQSRTRGGTAATHRSSHRISARSGLTRGVEIRIRPADIR